MTSPSPPNSIFDIDALERGELKVLSRDVYSSNQLSYTISEEKTDTERETNIETDTDTSNHDGTWWRVVMGFIVLLILQLWCSRVLIRWGVMRGVFREGKLRLGSIS